MHDVAWAVSSFEWAHTSQAASVQGLLATGLEKLFSLAIAASHEERSCILPVYRPYHREDFLYKALDRAFRASSSSQNVERKSFFDDPDPGPANAWRWADVAYPHHLRPIGPILSELQRQWGYVMWDKARLERSEVLRSSLVATTNSLPRLSAAYRPNWRQSLPRRRALFNLGGRGWWDSEDESKVIYPGRKVKVRFQPLRAATRREPYPA